jgi:hypothetical protein
MLLSYDLVNHQATALDSLDLLLQIDRPFLYVNRISGEDNIVWEKILFKNQQPILFPVIFFPYASFDTVETCVTFVSVQNARR